MKKLIFLFLFFTLTVANAQLFRRETSAVSSKDEPKTISSPDEFIRDISLADTNLPVARIERGIIFVGPRTRTKYKVVYSSPGQTVTLFDRHFQKWHPKKFNDRPRYLITSPHTKAIQDVPFRPDNGVYKDRRANKLYLIISEQERIEQQKKLDEKMLDSDAGLQAKSIFKIGDKVTFFLLDKSKITGTINSRSINDISINVESKHIKGATYKKTFNWEDINPKYLEQIMPERYADNMLEDGYVKYNNKWLKATLAEKMEMTDKGLVMFNGSWITAKEHKELTSFIKLPRF